MFEVGLNGLHEVEAEGVDLGDIVEAALLDGAVGDVGSGSGEADAEGPAGIVDLLSAFTCALLQLGLACRGGLALLVLVGALLLNALLQRLRLGRHEGEEHQKHDDQLHSLQIL